MGCALSTDATVMMIQAFVSSWLDYCDSVLNGITENIFQQLQSVQNTTARLITQTGWREHITPVLRRLHWHVQRRADFLLAFLTYKALHGLALPYISNDCL